MRKQIETTTALMLLMFSTPLLAAQSEGSSVRLESASLFDEPGFLVAVVIAIVISLGIPLAVAIFREIRESMQINQLIHK
ncbi:hypothetical protein [Solemya velum gill symbiont]|uniref:Uncharacterized protein n=1 Tax=Solemya velum gill symbiont TaxID=2340 RepID=A0A0B0HA43_SOVGS|nr:hypothetical protein [Solemya velum gill symbiont]KHF25935.1 hypothetical protein JV46_13630 [Solemya velum gill symbiont]OOY34451.1 hypothetical protein BOV88_09860 [Solemya velum gill symbiont]OOY37163.1 hypothetical protein BOV89_08700 [Solemya velum gill symbiont]OOY41177.1 hypothetical protein BOV90_00135 [Solemya velum gill symbiont]OOY41788.1 hypothetical protein BOV91_09630 [Solemya velum gill symbiont]